VVVAKPFALPVEGQLLAILPGGERGLFRVPVKGELDEVLKDREAHRCRTEQVELDNKTKRQDILQLRRSLNALTVQNDRLNEIIKGWQKRAGDLQGELDRRTGEVALLKAELDVRAGEIVVKVTAIEELLSAKEALEVTVQSMRSDLASLQQKYEESEQSRVLLGEDLAALQAELDAEVAAHAATKDKVPPDLDFLVAKELDYVRR
jgi:chromosome segregation ATPase